MSDFADHYDLPDELDQRLAPALAHSPMGEPYPTGLSLDLVLNPDTPITTLLEAYRLTPLQFKAILRNPAFRQEYDQHKEDLKKEGWSFKQKSKAQAELLLGTTWKLIHDEKTPSNVKADLIKSTIRWAGYETPPASPAAATLVTLPGTSTQVPQEMLEQLRNMPDAELEARVTHIMLRRTAKHIPADAQLDAAIEQVLDAE